MVEQFTLDGGVETHRLYSVCRVTYGGCFYKTVCKVLAADHMDAVYQAYKLGHKGKLFATVKKG